MMPVFGKRVDGPGGRRRACRERVVLAGAALTLEKARSVVVEDLCSSGAKLRGRDLPKDGDELLVKVGLVEILAHVAWSARDECGIRFEQALDPGCVEQFKNEGRLGHVMGIA